ncbi:hypothetical protein M1D80_09505 [Phyllobacteriaceae bacterium JZ32]
MTGKSNDAARDATHVAANKDYNPIFENLVINSDDGDVLGVIAYGSYKRAKWEWAQDIWNKHGRPPNESELKAYIATWTPTQFTNARNTAAQVLTEYADTVIQAAKADIVKEALKGRFWINVFTSIFAAALYTIILIVLAFIAAKAGIDLLGIFERSVS